MLGCLEHLCLRGGIRDGELSRRGVDTAGVLLRAESGWSCLASFLLLQRWTHIEDLGPSWYVGRLIQAHVSLSLSLTHTHTHTHTLTHLPSHPKWGWAKGGPCCPEPRGQGLVMQAWLNSLMSGSLSAPPASLEPQLPLPLSLQFLSSLTQPGSPVSQQWTKPLSVEWGWGP